MKIALISDLHANYVALKAVLDDARAAGVDKVICLGDVATLGPQPKETIALLRENDIPCIMGNHDSYLFDLELIYPYTREPAIIDSIKWCIEQLDQSELDFVRSFVPTLDVKLNSHANLFCYHGSPRSNTDNILPTTSIPELEAYLSGYSATVFAGGHTHIQMARQHRGSLIINPGSLGQPFEKFVDNTVPNLLPWSEYAIVSYTGNLLDVSLRRVHYDVAAYKASIEACDIPLKGWMLSEFK